MTDNQRKAIFAIILGMIGVAIIGTVIVMTATDNTCKTNCISFYKFRNLTTNYAAYNQAQTEQYGIARSNANGKPVCTCYSNGNVYYDIDGSPSAYLNDIRWGNWIK